MKQKKEINEDDWCNGYSEGVIDGKLFVITSLNSLIEDYLKYLPRKRKLLPKKVKVQRRKAVDNELKQYRKIP